MTAQDLETFTKLVETAQSQFLNDEANRSLRSAQDFDDVSTAVEKPPVEEKQVEENVVSDGVVTTEEELQAYSIIKAICCADVPVADIALRDAKSYCAILFQDNNRKPIARLYFDRRVPRIGIFGEEKSEQYFDLETVEDIYQHADLLRKRCQILKAE